MIPPLLMDVQPHHYVSYKPTLTLSSHNAQCLDMCAAPGSKVNTMTASLKYFLSPP